jgi:GntR family transcriptional regulator
MPRAIPYWRRIVDDIRAQIADGRLRSGDKLPTTAELARRYEVAPGTVRDGINRLIQDGTLVGHQGVGVFVA